MNNVDSINRQILELNHRKKKLELEINGINSTIQFLREQKETYNQLKKQIEQTSRNELKYASKPSTDWKCIFHYKRRCSCEMHYGLPLCLPVTVLLTYHVYFHSQTLRT